MTTTVTVKRKIVVNGREYASPEELPDDLRRAYEAAVGNRGGGSITRIKFNGREYAGVDEMPADVRRLYDLAVAALNQNPAASSAAGNARATAVLPGELVERNGIFVSASPPPEISSVKPAPSVSRNLKLGVVIALIFLLCTLIFVLTGQRVSR